MRSIQVALSAAVAVCSVSVILVGAPRQDLKGLDELTLPTSRLPAGCHLSAAPSRPATGDRVQGGLWAGLPITSNPWTGGERPIVAAIRERLDGPTMLPDGPPLERRELEKFRAHLADGVEVAYAAIYSSDNPGLVVVYAVRFASERSTAAAVRATARTGLRFVSGRTLVGVSGDSSCFPAVATYLKELLNR
jgi:hypothetical protein